MKLASSPYLVGVDSYQKQSNFDPSNRPQHGQKAVHVLATFFADHAGLQADHVKLVLDVQAS